MLIKKFKTNEEKNILNWWNDWGLKTPDIECLPKKGYVVTYNNIKEQQVICIIPMLK